MTYYRYLLLVLVLFFVNGCSGGQPGVSGTVTFDGEPVSVGHVRFVPQSGSGGEFTAVVNEGKFSLRRNNIAGDHKVFVVISFADKGGAADFYAQMEAAGPGGVKKGSEENSHEFRETLTNGNNVFQYDIQSEPAPADS